MRHLRHPTQHRDTLCAFVARPPQLILNQWRSSDGGYGCKCLARFPAHGVGETDECEKRSLRPSGASRLWIIFSSVMRNPSSVAIRIDAAKAAAPYVFIIVFAGRRAGEYDQIQQELVLMSKDPEVAEALGLDSIIERQRLSRADACHWIDLCELEARIRWFIVGVFHFKQSSLHADSGQQSRRADRHGSRKSK